MFPSASWPSLGVQRRFLICSSLAAAGRLISTDAPGLLSQFPKLGKAALLGRREHLSSGLQWMLTAPSLPGSLPVLRIPGEGKVRTHVSSVCGLFFFFSPGQSNSEAVFQVFVFVLSVPR